MLWELICGRYEPFIMHTRNLLMRTSIEADPDDFRIMAVCAVRLTHGASAHG